MSSKLGVVLFFVYGALLSIAGMYLAGFGHGSYLLLTLAGAPFSLLGSAIAALACLIQFGLLAILLHGWKRAPTFVIGYLILHYLGAALAVHLALNPDDTDLEHLNGMLPGFTAYLAMSLLLYAAGQIALWNIALKSLRRRTPSAPKPLTPHS